MKLARLSTENIRGLPDLAHAFTDRAGVALDAVLITGGPGSGKTSLLEAIAAAKDAAGCYPGVLFEAARLLRRGAERGRIEATWILTAAECDRAGVVESRQTTVCEIANGLPQVEAHVGMRRLLAGYSHAPARGKFEYFHAARRLCDPSLAARAPSSEAAEARVRLSNAIEKYAGLVRHLGDLARAQAAQVMRLLDTQGIAMRTQQSDALTPYREAVAAVLPGVRLVGVEPEERSVRVLFQKREGTVLELAELSESERQAVLFALTFRRLGLNHSVVLIDTPELHVHPSRQADFFTALCALGRDNQIFAATSSPELLRCVRPEQVIDLSSGRER
jgi:hypothetical protein